MTIFFLDLHCFRDFFSFRVCISLKKGLQILKHLSTSILGDLQNKSQRMINMHHFRHSTVKVTKFIWLGVTRISKLPKFPNWTQIPKLNPKFPNWTQSWLWVWVGLGYFGLTLGWFWVGLLKSLVLWVNFGKFGQFGCSREPLDDWAPLVHHNCNVCLTLST